MPDGAGVGTEPLRLMSVRIPWSGRRAPVRRERVRLRWALGVSTAVVVALVVPAVSHAASYIQIDAGYYHTCAIKAGGTPICWGSNAQGQTTIPAGTGTVTQITAGAYHTCAIKTDSTSACWGRNDNGQTTIPAGTGTVTQITADLYHTCAIKTDRAAVCWGYNGQSQATVPPHNAARPVLSGAPKVGSVLTATDGGWDNAPTALRVCVAALHDEQHADGM